MKKKAEYIKPVTELVKYESVDILTTSNEEDLNSTGDNYTYNNP